MKSFDRTKILLSLAVGCVIVTSGIYTYFFIAMKSKTDESSNLSTRLHEYSGEQLHYASTASALRAERANIEKLTTYFIKESEIVAFTKKLEALGPKSGVTLTIASLDPVIAQGSEPTLSFKITAAGKFEDVEQLLILLQNFPGKFEWKSVRLSHEGGLPIETGKGQAKAGASLWRVEASLDALNFIAI